MRQPRSIPYQLTITPIVEALNEVRQAKIHFHCQNIRDACDRANELKVPKFVNVKTKI